MDIFEPQEYKLRIPIESGELKVEKLVLQPPVLKDLISAEKYEPNTLSFARAFLSSLTGIPEIVLNKVIPEDWADIRILLSQQYQRFTGEVNLFDRNGEGENPTAAENTR